ncbi:MAG: serine/threonine protein kinase, partial [Planctomycetota bacterium]|nr:serine/threonine protein kinase [Planctomycetota bacterium]
MPVNNTDRNLLFGFLALQNDFISREDLIAAVSVWLTDKSQPLGEILLQRQALQQDEHELLAALTRKHLERHGDDAQKSLTALSSLGSLRDELQSLGAADVEVEASLSLVGRDREAADPYATVGASTSAGTRFVILRPHAKGGLGEVFVAQDGELHRQVALKQIQQQYADAPDSRARFLLEAEITGGLEHPGIVPVYGLGQYADGRPFYAMRFIGGDNLQQAADRFHAGDSSGPPQTAGERELEFRKLLGRFIDVCNAVEYAHSRGVLHRDLKPGNIMLGKYGETLVVDWGLAKVQGRDEQSKAGDEHTLRPSSGSGSAPTMMGQAIGTPAYMPPEQAAGKLDQLGPPSDVYSLGATLYYVLTGRSAFPSQELGETLRKVQAGEFPRPCEVHPRVPKPLDAICVKAMALRPADRYASPQELADDVERYLADEPVAAHAEPVHLRARRWLRKHPKSVAALAATLLVGLTSLLVIATVVGGKNRQLAQAYSEERKAKISATTNAQLADAKAAEALAEKARADEKALEAIAEKGRADEKAAEAIAEKARADEKTLEARRNLYFSHMNLAQAAWEDAHVGPLLELLDEHAPKPSEPDLRGFEWYYWDRLAHSYLLDLKGHTGGVLSVAFSPDGLRLASARWDGTVKVWDAATGQESLTLKGHTGGGVHSVAFSLDGQRLASASGDQTVKVWDAATGQESLTLKGHTDWVTSVAFSPDGQRLASVSEDNTVKVWDAATGQELLTLIGHTGDVTSVAFSPDGQRLASASADQTVKVWDATTGQESLTLKGHTGGALSVAFSADGLRLASASWDGTVKVWDAA